MDHNISNKDLTSHRRSLDALTGIRFFAAFYVVLFHSKLSDALATHHRIAGHFVENGFSAVSLFFLLSGFILAYTYSKRVATAEQRRRFWEARFARLYPVYLISLIVTMAVHRLLPKLAYIVAAALMVQAWNPFDKQMWGACNYVCWTLSVEAFFYLLFPWYQQAMERFESRGIILSTCGFLVLAIAVNSTRQVLGYQGAFYSVPLPLLRLPEFFVGIGLGNLFLKRDGRQKLSGQSLLPGGGLITYAAAVLSILLLCRTHGPLMSLVLIPFTMLILGLAGEPSFLARALSSKVVVFGGAISYSVYVLQVAAKDFTIQEANKFHVGSSGLRFAGLMVILFLASILTYEGVEVPMRERIRAYFARVEEKRADKASRPTAGVGRM